LAVGPSRTMISRPPGTVIAPEGGPVLLPIAPLQLENTVCVDAIALAKKLTESPSGRDMLMKVTEIEFGSFPTPTSGYMYQQQ